MSRLGANPQFFSAHITASRTQQIWGPISTYVSASGQATGDSLPASEQFGYGGSQFGRAFDPSEFTADNGGAMTLEARYDAARSADLLTQLFAFADIGHLWPNSQDKSFSAASAGGGFRMWNNQGMSAQMTIAAPLLQSLKSETSGTRITLGIAIAYP